MTDKTIKSFWLSADEVGGADAIIAGEVNRAKFAGAKHEIGGSRSRHNVQSNAVPTFCRKEVTMTKGSFSHQHAGLYRRDLLLIAGTAAAALASSSHRAAAASGETAIKIEEVRRDEDVFAYLNRMNGGFTQRAYQQVIGAANEFKEGDQTIGVGAEDDATRLHARALLTNTKIGELYEHPLFEDNLQRLIWQTTDQAQFEKVKDWTMGRLKDFLLNEPEETIKAMMTGLTSDTIGCVPKLMTNQELISLSNKIFNVMPRTKMGAKGYMGARIQPNFSHRSPRRHRLAGVRCVFLCDRRYRHRHQSGGQHRR